MEKKYQIIEDGVVLVEFSATEENASEIWTCFYRVSFHTDVRLKEV